MATLTQKAKYALKALVHLARAYQQGPVLISTIAETEHIPRKFLQGILLELKYSGYLQSRKGRGGGYWLVRDPADVYLGHVMRIFEGPLAPIACVSKRSYARCKDCDDEATCEVRRAMLDVKLATLNVLDNTSVADAIARRNEPIEL